MDSARAALRRGSWGAAGFRRVWPGSPAREKGKVKLFDKSKDGRLDLSDLARILALQENFLLQFKMDPSVRGADLERLRSLLRHCHANRDGKIQKAELGSPPHKPL